jgi:hypothetical protein
MYLEMSKKILTVLAPVAAIVAFMAIPALAQATTTQCGTVLCANGAGIVGQSSNLVTTTSNPTGELKCTGSEFQGTINAAQAVNIEGSVTKDVLSGCTANKVLAHVWTNASTEMEREQRTMADEQEQKKDGPWTLQIQQPEASGHVVAHLLPHTGSKIEFTVQIQVFGFSVATCMYAAQDGSGNATSIQLEGTEQVDTLSVTGSNQFVLTESNSSECGTVGTTKGTLTGTIQNETDEPSPKAVVVHMTE